MFPKLPEPTHGLLIFGNFNTMNSRKYKFEIEPLKKEFFIVLNAYYGKGDIKESAFFRLGKD